MILHVDSCGYETGFGTLRKDRRLLVLENGALRKICGPKRVVVTREWRRLLAEELYALYSPNNFRVNK